MTFSSIYPQSLTTAATPITAGNDILTSDISITTDMIRPGGGATLRLLFSFAFAVSPAAIQVFNNGSLKGTLNADNAGQIVNDGYYRFDIDVEGGDGINLQATENISTINFVRAHLVLFGT